MIQEISEILLWFDMLPRPKTIRYGEVARRILDLLMKEWLDKHIGNGYYTVESEYLGERINFRGCSADLEQVWQKMRKELDKEVI